MASGNDVVDRLERKLTQWRALALVALVVSAASLTVSVISLRSPEEIRARAFVVVDAAGEVVGRFGEVKNWGPVLSVQAKQARATVMVGSMGADAGVAIVAEDGTTAQLAIGANGGPGLSVHGPGNSKVLAGFSSEKARPVIRLFDDNGNLLTVSTDGAKTTPAAERQP